jgi:transposase
MRKTHTKDFKFKVAIEAIRGDMTIAQIVSKYQVAESLIHRWKKQLLDQGSEVFSKVPSSGSDAASTDIEKLHAKIGKLTLDCDFLEKALLTNRCKSAKV